MKIICVDDEKLILNLTVSMCRELSCKPEVEGFQSAGEAFEHLRTHEADIALLDINLADINGIELAARMQELRPGIAIIVLPGYSEYALDAIKMHASGYLMKPLNAVRLEEEIRYATEMLEMKKHNRQSGRVFIRTFGSFDVLLDDNAVLFSRARSKELLAYLVDRCGSFVTRKSAFSALWDDRQYDRSMQKQFDVVLRSLRQTLEQNGIGEIMEINKGNLRVVPERFVCDLYRFYEGEPQAVNAYQGEYMSEYAWANDTEAKLFHFIKER